MSLQSTTTAKLSPSSSPTVSPSPTPTQYIAGGGSFVGNTSSTVLFFLALAVGVFIATVFIFFTIRYFVRSKYGLHIYPIPQRSIFMASSSTVRLNATNSPPVSDADLQEQLDYLREHVFSGDLDRTLLRRRRRRRRRRARYSRMKKLTEEEVDKLFPRQSYNRWLNGGQEEAKENRGTLVHEETEGIDGDFVDENQLTQSEKGASKTEDDEVNPSSSKALAGEPHELENELGTSNDGLDSGHSPEMDISDIELQNISTSTSQNNKHEELHFTSGTCAICLEILEDDNVVRGLVCGHVFHADCLDPWLTKRRACCPMCKRDYFYKGTNQQPEGADASSGDRAENSETSGDAQPTGTETTDNSNRNNIENTPTTNSENNDNSNNNHNDNENPAEDEDLDDDMDSLDLEAFRNDPTLRAMIQELIPLQERVRFVLANPDFQDLGIEEEARERAKKKFSNVFKALWWRIMGISREDMFHWAVLQIYSVHRSERDQRLAEEAEAAAAQQEEAAQSAGADDGGNNIAATTVEETGAATPTTPPLTADQVPTNAHASRASMDIVSQRV